MPVRVSFVLTRSYLQGSVLVEATDDPERAIEMVEQMSNEQLIEHTCESEWDVDAWVLRFAATIPVRPAAIESGGVECSSA